MSVRWSTIFPNKPTLTEKNLPDQSGKVFLIPGASGGLSKEIASILYQKNGKIYMAARSRSKTNDPIDSSTGNMIFLSLVLDDLTTIKASASEFLAQESRLDVLYNNAGVMVPPQGSKTVQGYELQIGVNNLAPFLFTNMDYHEEGIWSKYSRSKAGNVLHAVEYARRTIGEGIISIALNPGNFVTNLQQNMPRMQLAVFKIISHAPKNGAYTQLFASHSPTVTEKDNGCWVSPFGKVEPARKDLLDTVLSKQYWEWAEEQINKYK
ncbi:hypothetical protein M441DRAFT_74531 [Trichoderma asperellum CBS 433.97]|uniref:NAD(P)-binding protein n=1 Tax=Trichoderma asperellum (strain ATCC 204424 / CBS 433.97 / NBRC 101777) TaxID=1042311 RepID=A0A2T3YRK0_TRIA4|nr:hypothetical protein M441DRAFT_74531 [Trichoderma asperellum CBS 433.97]PTB35154.1 hypothetical protein M441DRAFT_74531 [Trichoderma asperellum CBS 433.97]